CLPFLQLPTTFLLSFLIVGIFANNPYLPNFGHHNNNNCDNLQYEPYPQGMNREGQPSGRAESRPSEILVNSNSDFAFKFFKEVSSNGGLRDSSGKKNLIFSPMCISSAFAMLALGARANTLDQILRGLNFRPTEIPERKIHEGFHDLIYMLNNGNSGLQVEMGNCLFVQNKLHPQDQFLNALRNIYGGDIYMENFKNTRETEQHINSYVERKTHGKISKLVDGVDPITEILLVSYIYMKAKWKKPFNPKHTEAHDFYVDPYTVVKVPMMFQMGMFEIGHDDERSCTVLKLPYDGQGAAYFILPDKGQMDRVATSLSIGALQSWKGILSRRSVNIYIPKCLVSGDSFLICTQNDLISFVLQAIHKAMIVIDEKGTEAAAGTSMDIIPMSVPTILKLEKPFIMMIVDECTNTILFMGKILNPVEK
uniref:Thyroxine-binding globulin n=1 Tax=Salvator merianae TaxID=96440 RepID=A0A8D0C9T6_SALMN